MTAPVDRWHDAQRAAAVFAIDPVAMGGVVVRASPGPVRDAWLALVRRCVAPGPWRKMPAHASEARLLGGLDLTATLAAGRPIAERGLYADSDGGVLLLSMAERIAPHTVGPLGRVLDTHVVALERDGVAMTQPARFGVIALDEGCDDERVAPALVERCAMVLALDAIAPRDVAAKGDAYGDTARTAAVADARARYAHVTCSAALLEALCAVALACGVDSLRAPLHALRVARASAALDGRDAVDEDDVAFAARTVIGPRATQLPRAPDDDTASAPDTDDPSHEPPQAPSPEPSPPEPTSGEASSAPPPDPSAHEEVSTDKASPDKASPDDVERDATTLDDRVIEAARAAIPQGVLERLRDGSMLRTARTTSSGRAGAIYTGRGRGRSIGTRRGEPSGGARLDVVETLRAAAPWQRLRGASSGAARVRIHRDDLRVARIQHRTGTTAVFVVDASGSSALHRLAEAKGAVERLLADCYVRRDQVALIAFRGTQADVALPPTRSLVRAKRSLAGLPGGGGTPLATALDAAGALCAAIRRRGETPVLVVLTDGRANIARDGQFDRPRAHADALDAARRIRAGAWPALFIDTSPRASAPAQGVADAMGARYLALPYADADTLSRAVRSEAAR